ncbi:aminopeptidase C [Bifidobacterium bombi]|nr:C1 family peptidase [Bifidobacterium bombi]
MSKASKTVKKPATRAGKENEKAISSRAIDEYSKRFNSERANRVAANASTSLGLIKAATSYQGVRSLPKDFSVDLKQTGITNQKQSGRCWMFAALNTLSFEVMHKWNLDDFEFSESYLFFWDKIEKSNTYLENVLATLDEDTDSRIFTIINYEPADDGGWWQMFVNLVNKYGLMPKSAFPESANSGNSDDFTMYLNVKLREFASQLREEHQAGASLDKLRELKLNDMETVYRICAISLGEPPKKFDFFARTKEDDKKEDCKDEKTKSDGKTKNVSKDAKDSKESRIDDRPQIREYGITPQEFYAKYVPVDVNDYVTLCNNPMKSRPFNRRYQLKFSTNVAETGPLEFVNVDMDTIHKAALDQLQAGHPLWFACDCDQYALLRGKEGIFDPGAVRVDELFGTEFTFDKAHALQYGVSSANHAMTFTGVNIDEDGQADRWKVENSWGKDVGEDGYYVASDEWFRRYVNELIVRKEFLPEPVLDALQSEPLTLEPWQSLSSICR